MMLFWRNKTLFTLLFFTFSFGIVAQDIPEPMYPYRLVNDFANVFTSAENQALEQKLLAYNDSTSTQLYVVTISDLGGYPASDYAFALGEKWGVGQKSKNNGLVILIKPKTEDSRGQAFIATGYGLEEFINDAYAGRIVRNEMIPYFQDDDYFGGVNAAVDAIIFRLSGEFDADAEDEGFPLLAVILTIIIIIIILQIISRGGDHYIDSGGHRSSGGGPIIFHTPSSRGGWGGGGFGGGGFGGGGGGSFGGGGAGGSW